MPRRNSAAARSAEDAVTAAHASKLQQFDFVRVRSIPPARLGTSAPLAWKFFATFAAEDSKHSVLEVNMLSGSSVRQISNSPHDTCAATSLVGDSLNAATSPVGD